MLSKLGLFIKVKFNASLQEWSSMEKRGKIGNGRVASL